MIGRMSGILTLTPRSYLLGHVGGHGQPATRLTPSDVRAIRAEWMARERGGVKIGEKSAFCREISVAYTAAGYAIHPQSVLGIINRESWVGVK